MSKANKAGRPAEPVQIARRLNYRALAILGVIVVAAIPGFFALNAFQNHARRANYLSQAKRAYDEGQPDLALPFINSYLKSSQNDLEGLELKGKILAKTARDIPTIEEAIRVQTLILAAHPGREVELAARKSLVELNLRPTLAGSDVVYTRYFAPARAAAEAYLAMGADDAEAHRLFARALQGVGDLGNQKDMARAVSEYETAQRMNPAEAAGAAQLANLYRSMKFDPARSEKVLDDLLKAAPKSVDARLARYEYYRKDPATEARATSELVEALKLDPTNFLARLDSADAALKRGDTADARRQVAGLPAPPSDNLRLRLNLIKGLIEFSEQRPDEGIQVWRSGLIDAGGSDANLTFRLAYVLLNLGRTAEAEPLMDQFRRLSGAAEAPPAYRYLVALKSLRAGHPADAIVELEAIRPKVHRDLEGGVLNALGDAYAAVPNDARAIEAYRQAATTSNGGPQPWISIAKIQLKTRPAGEAIATLERGLSSNPNNASLLTLLANVLYAQEAVKPRDRRDWSEFLTRLGQAERVAPGVAEVMMVRAEYLAAIGQMDVALSQIEQATEQSPTAISPWVARINALSRLGRLDDAMKVIDEATRAAGEHAQFRLAKVRLLLRRGEPKSAYECLTSALDKVPVQQRGEIWKSLGDFHLGRSDYANARRSYEEWSRLSPTSPDPLLTLLSLEISAGDAPAMIAQADAIKKLSGADSVVAKSARVEVLLALKPREPGGNDPEDRARSDEATKLIDQIIAQTPGTPGGLLLRGRLMDKLGSNEEAIKAYRAALDIRGGQAALRPLVVLLSKENRKDELDDLRRKLESFPPELDQLLGKIAINRGDAALAEQMADRMLQGSPGNLDAAVWNAKVLNTVGKTREAEDVLRFAIGQKPEDATIWIQLLLFQIATKQNDAALNTVDEMKRQIKTERPDLLWASCYTALGLLAKADQAYEAALAKRPDDLLVLQPAVEYYDTTKRPKQAEALLRHMLAVRPDFDWARRRLALDLSERQNDPTAWSEAIALAGQVSAGADSPDDRQLRATVLLRSPDPKRREEAVAVLESVVRDSPNPGKLHAFLARTLRAMGEGARAREHAKAAAGPDAGVDEVLSYADLLLQDNDIPAAEEQLTRLIKIDAQAVPTIELKARLQHAKKDDAGAVATLEALLDSQKGGPNALTVASVVFQVLTSIGQGAAGEALALKVAATGPKGKLLAAEFLEGRGKADDARKLIDEAAKSGNINEALRVSLKLAGDRGGDDAYVRQADGLLTTALKGKPETVEMLQTQAYLKHLQRDYVAEVKFYEEVLAKNPGNYLLMNNMAWTLSEDLNQPERGLAKVSEAIEKAGWQAHMADTRGVIMLRLGRFDEAIKDLEAAAAVQPSGSTFFHLARAYKAAGREADFRRALDSARKAGLKLEQLQPSERQEAAKWVGPLAEKTAASSRP